MANYGRSLGSRVDQYYSEYDTSQRNSLRRSQPSQFRLYTGLPTHSLYNSSLTPMSSHFPVQHHKQNETYRQSTSQQFTNLSALHAPYFRHSVGNRSIITRNNQSYPNEIANFHTKPSWKDSEYRPENTNSTNSDLNVEKISQNSSVASFDRQRTVLCLTEWLQVYLESAPNQNNSDEVNSLNADVKYGSDSSKSAKRKRGAEKGVSLDSSTIVFGVKPPPRDEDSNEVLINKNYLNFNKYNIPLFQTMFSRGFETYKIKDSFELSSYSNPHHTAYAEIPSKRSFLQMNNSSPFQYFSENFEKNTGTPASLNDTVQVCSVFSRSAENSKATLLISKIREELEFAEKSSKTSHEQNANKDKNWKPAAFKPTMQFTKPNVTSNSASNSNKDCEAKSTGEEKSTTSSNRETNRTKNFEENTTHLPEEELQEDNDIPKQSTVKDENEEHLKRLENENDDQIFDQEFQRKSRISIPTKRNARKGLALLNDYIKNKGLVFSEEERERLGLRGLLPPRVLSPQQQLDWCLKCLERIPDDLDKYVYLRELQDTNEHLFYQCMIEHVDVMLPIVYTPVVGLACQNYGVIYRKPRGLFVSIRDLGQVEQVLRNWPTRDVRAIVVTDGERILGLGDLGAHGMGIPVGKLAIYTSMGGIQPHHCLPVTLDVGTNNEEFLKEDSTYLGLRQKRVRGEQYQQLLDEFMSAVVKVFGRHTLVQFEDFANKNAFSLLRRYRDQYTMFNDDIQGTAAVTVAGLLAAFRHSGLNIADAKILFVGAGEAGVGIANLLVATIGGDPQEARKRIYMKRSNKLIVEGDEKNFDDDDDRRLFCHSVPEGADIVDLVNIIKWLKPNILIGASGAGKLITQEVLETMAKINEKPIIFALSNPTSKSECTAEEAYKYTEGRCLFASGSPFSPVEVEGRLRHPKQCNNAYIFPGIALAITTGKMTSVPDEVFLIAAKTLGHECLQQSEYDVGSLYPSLERLRDCSVQIATNILQYAFDNGLATLRPQPTDIKAFLLDQLYSPHSHDHNHHHDH